MKPLENILDRLVQEWASSLPSYVSNSRDKIVGHHYIGRANKLLRWDRHNIIPLTYEEHTRHHAGGLPIEIKSPFRKQYLENMKNKSFKDFLLENGLTEDEFLKLKYEEWNEQKTKNF